MTTPYIRPCPFCGQREHLVEQLDSDASVVICQAMVDEHSACLARGPVGLQQDERGEDQPGRDEAIRLWNTWVDVAAEGVMAQQEAELERKERVIESLKAQMNRGQAVAFTTEGMLDIALSGAVGRIGAKVEADDRFNVPLYTVDPGDRRVTLLNMAEHALRESSFDSTGKVIDHDQAMRDRLRSKIAEYLLDLNSVTAQASSALGKSEHIPSAIGGMVSDRTYRALTSAHALNIQLRQQLAGLLGTAEGLLDSLINATEGFEGEEQVSEDDRKEYLDQFEAAQKLLDSLKGPQAPV